MTARNLLFSVLCLGANFAAYAHPPETTNPMKFVQISAKDRDQRSDIANHGVSIEFVRSDSVWGFANESMMNALKKDGFKILGQFEESVGRGGHEGILDFPRKDDLYHNYAETLSALQALEAANPEYVKLSSIGKSTEGRDLWAVHLNSDQIDRDRGNSNKPGAIFMGNHHAREHLSVEVPLMFAEYLLKNKTDPRIKRYLDSLDIWIIPMVNPDGAEFDIATGRYQTWRKNRSVNFDGTYGTDLNRNYGYQWGTGGSSKDTNSEVYMGKAPFSEPETQAIRDFVSSHLNSKVLLTFHTYSELILYPWGYSKDSVNQVNPRDFKVFETMAQKMATWNHYEPMQASDLYIASGDTTDWAYGTHGIFAFTL
ncbi:MAG: zinc carboxypeptidase, partial [Proteobacteria bacterium]